MVAQLQVRLLSGRTALVEGERVRDVATLREHVAALEGVPAELLRLTRSGRELHDASPWDDAPVAVLLRLLGGKGGFGAMLRQGGSRGVKTTNFDACRDLNGRRLRHINAEAQLREWDAKAEERKLKKQQEAALKAKPSGPVLAGRFDDEEYEEMLEGARNRVSDALAAAVASSAGSSSASGGSGEAITTATGPEASDAAASAPTAALTSEVPQGGGASGKRKMEAVAPAPPMSVNKTAKVWDPLAMLEGDGEEDSEEDEDGAAVGGA